MTDRNFGNIIWTNHALKRLAERGIKQGDAWATWRNPDQSRYATAKGAWVFYKSYPSTSSGQARKIEVVAKEVVRPPARWGLRPGGKQWVVMSVWDKPGYEKFANENEKMEPLWKLIYKRLFQKKKKKTD